MWPLCGLRVKQTTVQHKLPSSHHFGKPKSLATRMRNIDGFIQKEFVFDSLHKVQQTIFCGLSARKARIFSSVSSCKSLLDSRVDLKLPATSLANNTIYTLHTEIGYTPQCNSNPSLHVTLNLLVDMCHPSTFLSFLHVSNSTSSVLSPQKRFMTLVCQMRHGDQVALGSTAGGYHPTNCKQLLELSFIQDLVWKSMEHINISTRQFLLVVLFLIMLWKSSQIFRSGTLEGQVLATLFYPTAPSAKSSAWVLRHSSKACVTSQASVASCREEMVAPYPYPSVRDKQIESHLELNEEWGEQSAS